MYSFAKRLGGLTGSAIRQIFALLSDPELISFAGGNPSPKSFPGEHLSEIAKEIISKEGSTVLQYGNTLGLPSLIDTVKNRMSDIGIRSHAKNIIITSGSTQGIEMCAKSFINPGETILTEEPTFIGALQTFFSFEANVVGVKTDLNGIDPNDLEEKIIAYKPKFLYTIPTFQNPSGKTMSYERRQDIYAVCKKYGVLILEDDPYREINFTSENIAPIKSLDSDGLVIYLTSMSKIISPGLRVGAAVAHEDIIAKFNICKQGEDVHTSNLSQAIVNRYLNSGDFPQNLKKSVEMYKNQCELMSSELKKHIPELSFDMPGGGLFIWGELPKGTDALKVFHRAVENKVAFVPGTHFFPRGEHENTLRLNFSMSSNEQIIEGVDRLAQAIKNSKI